jgi:hypothetical protein
MANSDFVLKIGRRHCAPYPSLKDARDAHNRMRYESGEGASSWPKSTIMQGSSIILVSYNGCCWDKNGEEIKVG